MSVQVPDHFRQRGKLCIQSEVQFLVHVVDIIPLDILSTNQHMNYYYILIILKGSQHATQRSQTKSHVALLHLRYPIIP